MLDIIIRSEQPEDIPAIDQVIQRAFANHPHSQQMEHHIVAELRRQQKLSLSVVAVKEDKIIGQVTCSPVEINSLFYHWYGLGPVAVLPPFQGQRVGTLMIRAAIIHMKTKLARGLVVVGPPNYYRRFGFQPLATLTLPRFPSSHFLALPIKQPVPSGRVSYHRAFSIKPALP